MERKWRGRWKKERSVEGKESEEGRREGNQERRVDTREYGIMSRTVLTICSFYESVCEGP